jgi:hypothetical protein
MNLLQIGETAADRIGIPRPTSLIGSSDQNARLLLSVAQQEGKDLASRHAWQAITKEKTFTSTATEVQSSVIPSDFDRFVDGTFWNRTENRLVLGPASAQEWQALKSDRIQAIHDIFRHRGNDLLLAPTPAVGASYAFEYVSQWWVATASDTGTPAQEQFEQDTDVPVIDSELVGLGVVWRFLRAKGLDYSEPFRSYELLLARKMGRDGGAQTLSMSGPSDKYPAPKPTIPDGNWNLS